MLTAVAGLALLGLFWRFGMQIGGGGDVTPDAYRNPLHHFALRVDPAWIMLTPANYSAVLAQYAGNLPPEIRSMIGAANGVEVGFLKIDADFTPSLNVVVTEGEPPPVDEESAAKGALELEKVYQERLSSYAQESTRIIEVDGIPALEIASRTTLHVKIADAKFEQNPGAYPGTFSVGEEISPAEFRDYEMRFVQTLVPGRERAYIVTATALVSQWPSVEAEFDAARKSFRVLERPKRFRGTMGAGVQGGLIGVALALLFILYQGLITGSRE